MIPLILGLASAYFGKKDSGGASGAPMSSGGSFAPGGMQIGPKVIGRGSASAVQTAANTAGAAPVPLPSTVPNAVAGTSSASLQPALSTYMPYIIAGAIALVAILAVAFWPTSRRK